MGIPILVRRHLYIETAPWFLQSLSCPAILSPLPSPEDLSFHRKQFQNVSLGLFSSRNVVYNFCGIYSLMGFITKSTLVEIMAEFINSLWPGDTIWRHGTRSTLAQVMACCLMAPSHYLNQCWLIISKVKWHSSKGRFTRDNSAINHWNYLEN